MEGPIPEIKDRFPVQYFKIEVEKRKYKNSSSIYNLEIPRLITPW